ncbi:hypothetical protein [Acetobacter oryzifermentans]|uniref:Uncharacterized protein n=1 Tax=Acetobacter oryzifermentans TaxID=1633874 RepID=A0ABM6AKH9_9PROT|nr:hypothetical protein [Acetobacter oryzifermentans]ANA14191.1 hypothetical protein WG31_09410 [Acetobacter oryzifermentans]
MNAIPCPAHRIPCQIFNVPKHKIILIRAQADALLAHAHSLESFRRACADSNNSYGAEAWAYLAGQARLQAELLYTRANIIESYIK